MMHLARCGGLTVTISISVHPSFSKVMFAPDISTMEHGTLLGFCCPCLTLLFGRTVPSHHLGQAIGLIQPSADIAQFK
jgi:hypothetical protein